MSIPSNLAEFSELYPAESISDEKLDWFRIKGTPRFDYPIDYWVAVLNVDEANDRIEFLSRWEPNSYCHYHRHVGETSLLVLEGEHNVVEKNSTETIHKTRTAGFSATNPGGDVHMEYGGPEGTLVYFNCKAEGGKLFDVMDKDGSVLNTATVTDFTTGAVKR